MGDENKLGNSTKGNIVASILIALLAGGSAPWWWSKVFPVSSTEHPKSSHYMSALEGNTDRPGADLSDQGIEVNSAEECSDLCLKNDNCRAMTFVKHPEANGGICWQKGSIPTPEPFPGRVSGVKTIAPK